jgi:predicted phosphate transport protein (TIGR00153 family)
MAKDKNYYFNALANQASFAQKGAQKLVSILENFNHENIMDQLVEMHEIENAADSQNHEIFKKLAREFITPIDREDIIEMAHRLDDIVDYTEDVLQQLYMYDVRELNESTLPFAVLMEKSSSALCDALGEFHNFKKSDTLNQKLIDVNDFEEDADELYMKTIRDLYLNHKDDAIYVVTWSNLFLRMERCVDACENVADMMATIALKNS